MGLVLLSIHAGNTVVRAEEDAVKPRFRVVDWAFCTDIDMEKKWCAGEGDTRFPADVGRLYCCTKIFASGDGKIYHNWIFEGKRVSSVELDVRRSNGYRTRSYKTIPEKYAGDWKVEVVADGEVIDTLHFTITPLVDLPSISR